MDKTQVLGLCMLLTGKEWEIEESDGARLVLRIKGTTGRGRIAVGVETRLRWWTEGKVDEWHWQESAEDALGVPAGETERITGKLG